MSPVAHTAAGLLGWQLTTEKKNWKTLAIFLFLANLPDIDHVMVFFMGVKGLDYHQFFTHNIFFATVSAMVFWPYFDRLKRGMTPTGDEKTVSIWRVRIGLLLVSFSHLFLDLITIDRVEPIGFRPFYPLYSGFFNLGFFPNLLKGSMAEAVSVNNILVVSLETAVILFPIIWFFRKPLYNRLHQKEFWKL